MKKRYFIIIILSILLINTNFVYYKKYITNEVKKIDVPEQIVKEVIPEIDIKSLQEEYNNKDIYAYLKIDSLGISSPIVQGKDNEYYLDHSIYKEKDSNGSIFLDYRNKFDDRKLLIYGHNSRTLKTALFHDLEKYIDKAYFEKHKYIELSLNNQKNTYEIFSVMIVTGNKHMKVTFNDKEFVQHISWMKKSSIYEINTNVGITDKTITLQTCYYEPSNSYLLINAKKIK